MISPVLGNEMISPEARRLRFLALSIAGEAAPGQFVHLGAAPRGSLDPLLRRPFSVLRVSPGEGWVEVGFRVVGRGTLYLAALSPGDRVDVLGPLGNGFRPADAERPLLVGGGTGAFGLLYLAEAFAARGIRPTVLLGFGNARESAVASCFEPVECKLDVSTEDGSRGSKGLVTEAARECLSRGDADAVFGCGPLPMLSELARLVETAGVRCQVSLEAAMACGIGACKGCVHPARGSGSLWKRVCLEGPVFDSKEVILEG